MVTTPGPQVLVARHHGLLGERNSRGGVRLRGRARRVAGGLGLPAVPRWGGVPWWGCRGVMAGGWGYGPRDWLIGGDLGGFFWGAGWLRMVSLVS